MDEKDSKKLEPVSEAPVDGVEDDQEEVLASHARDEDPLRDMMATNFIEYASYVIKERAIPDVVDGMKPVQRRILHSLNVIDDGRFHKVANVIGHTMQYHPHGDASIGNALVVLANKDYFIEKQGNFGNIYTGDDASAPRYIECRLTPLAREVLFNKEITEFVDSYDGRNQEPVRFPAKVPALLLQGAEGIAVGMTTRVLPHNFNELLEAQIAILEEKPFKVYPDFLTGGLMDVKEYADGAGKVRLRARIDEVSDKCLVIREIPATTTTESLIASVEDAARRGKIKIASINDYTAEKVEIEIQLPRGIYAKETISQLYAYTDCEVSISSNLNVIRDNTPVQMTVSEVLELNTRDLVHNLKRELEIELGKLQDSAHQKTLVQLFIEKRIYKRIEECEQYEQIFQEIRTGFEPFSDQLRRELLDEDIERLLQIQIPRISLFDLNKNKQDIDDILKKIEETNHHLAHLTEYAIAYIRKLLEKFGKTYPRRTVIDQLKKVDVKQVALRNLKVGHDRKGNFVGHQVKNSNKNDDYLMCAEVDRLVLMQNTGEYQVVPVPDKLYAGPLKYVLMSDKDQVYSMIYRDRKKKIYYAKRFRIDRYIMERDYTTLPANCIIEGLYTNYGVVVRCDFKPNKRLKETSVDVVFDDIPIRSAGARGFKITAKEIVSFTQTKRGTAEPPEEPEEEPVEAEEVTTEKAETPKSAPKSEPPKPVENAEKAAKAEKPPRTKAETPKSAPKSEPPKPAENTEKAAKAEKPPRTKAETPQKDEVAEDTENAETVEKPEKVKKTSNVKTSAEPVAASEPAVSKTSKPAESSKKKAKSGADKDKTKAEGRILIDEDTPFFLE